MIQSQRVSLKFFFNITYKNCLKFNSFSLGLPKGHIIQPFHKYPEVKVLPLNLNFSAFNLRHIQHIVNQRQQMSGRKIDFFSNNGIASPDWKGSAGQS